MIGNQINRWRNLEGKKWKLEVEVFKIKFLKVSGRKSGTAYPK